MPNTVISFTAECSANDIVFTATLDDRVFYHGPLSTQPQTITVDLDDSVDAPHRLCLTMSGKTPEHTKIDGSLILEDALIRIGNLSFDDIKLGHAMVEHCRYRHDFNGTQAALDDKFFGDMGCNGTVTLDFTSPIYVWLLENM